MPRPRKPLTEKNKLTTHQRAVLEAIVDLKRKTSISPTLEEIGKACGKSTQTIRYYIDRFIRDGYIRKHSRCRGIEIIKPQQEKKVNA
jgi:SOS-response transcriptional repressor LexA